MRVNKRFVRIPPWVKRFLVGSTMHNLSRILKSKDLESDGWKMKGVMNEDQWGAVESSGTRLTLGLAVVGGQGKCSIHRDFHLPKPFTVFQSSFLILLG